MSDRLRDEIDEGLQFYLGKDYEWYKKHKDIDDWIFELVSTQLEAEVDNARREGAEEAIESLNWMKVLDEAVKSRPTSWNKDPIWEYRNASDEVKWAVKRHLIADGKIPDRMKEAAEFVEKRKAHLNTQESEDTDE